MPKTIKYMPTQLGKDPKNPLVDLNPDQRLWYFNTLVNMTATISEYGQSKDEYVWTQLIKRRPKQISKGRNGPNSLVSLVTGLLGNYIHNTEKYGQCRVSLRQLEDFEFACLFFNAVDSEKFEPIMIQQALFSAEGVDF